MKGIFKIVLFSAMSTLLAFFAITYSSCNNDKCKAIVCAYGGVCNDGACMCQTGYEGTQCETESRVKFGGEWEVYEKGLNTNASQYALTIGNGATVSDIVIKNFNNTIDTLVAAYVKGDTMYIPTQIIKGKSIVGSGYFTQDLHYAQNAQMNVIYKVTDTATGKEYDYGYDAAADNTTPSLWNKR